MSDASGTPNPVGIQYYKNLIAALLAANIQPMVFQPTSIFNRIVHVPVTDINSIKTFPRWPSIIGICRNIWKIRADSWMPLFPTGSWRTPICAIASSASTSSTGSHSTSRGAWLIWVTESAAKLPVSRGRAPTITWPRTIYCELTPEPTGSTSRPIKPFNKVFSDIECLTLLLANSTIKICVVLINKNIVACFLCRQGRNYFECRLGRSPWRQCRIAGGFRSQLAVLRRLVRSSRLRQWRLSRRHDQPGASPFSYA